MASSSSECCVSAGIMSQDSRTVFRLRIKPHLKRKWNSRLRPPTPSYNDLKYFFIVTWEGGVWYDVPVCTSEYFKPFISCKIVLWICLGKEDLTVKVVSTQTTGLMAKWCGGEGVVPCSCIWKKQVQAPNLEGRQPFEVKNEEISKLKGLGYVFIPCCRKYVIPFPMTWHLGIPPLCLHLWTGATGTLLCCRVATVSVVFIWGSSASCCNVQVKYTASSPSFLCWSERVEGTAVDL